MKTKIKWTGGQTKRATVGGLSLLSGMDRAGGWMEVIQHGIVLSDSTGHRSLEEAQLAATNEADKILNF